LQRCTPPKRLHCIALQTVALQCNAAQAVALHATMQRNRMLIKIVIFMAILARSGLAFFDAVVVRRKNLDLQRPESKVVL
jgi:hypothetical protein